MTVPSSSKRVTVVTAMSPTAAIETATLLLITLLSATVEPRVTLELAPSEPATVRLGPTAATIPTSATVDWTTGVASSS